MLTVFIAINAYNDGVMTANQTLNLIETVVPDPNLFTDLKRLILSSADMDALDEEEEHRQRTLAQTMKRFQNGYYSAGHDGHLSTVAEESRSYF